MIVKANLAPLFDQVLNKLQAGVILLDDQLNVCFWNEWLAQHSGIPCEEILGKSLTECLGIRHDSYLIQRARQAISPGLSSILSNTIHRHPLPLYSLERNNELIEQKLILSHLRSCNENYCLVHVYDVSEVRRRENSIKRQAKTLQSTVNELTQAEQQVVSIFDLSPDAIFILDAQGQILRINAAAEKMFNIVEYPSIYNFIQLIEELDEEIPFEQQFFGNAHDDVADNFHLTGVSLNDRHFPVKLSVLKTGTPEQRNYSIICRDISETQATEKRLKQLAHYDSLTGLANRATFNDSLSMTLKNAQRYQRKVALIFVDMDNLKPVNDNFGHRGGDTLLRETAKRLKHSLRDTDLVARIGGDEFTIILSESHEHELPDLTVITERLLKKIMQPLIINGESITPSASIGITVNSSFDPDELVRHADIAMYTAKQSGKGKCVFYEEEMGSKAR